MGEIYLDVNPIMHVRTRHMEVDYYFFKKQVTHGTLCIHIISSVDKLADDFTVSPFNFFVKQDKRCYY